MKWMLILFYWVREYPVTDLAHVAGLDPKTAVDAYQWLRKVCSTDLSTDLLQTQIVLGYKFRLMKACFGINNKKVFGN